MSRILLADDDPEQLAVQRKLLESLGYQVDTAPSPREALLALEKQPDLILIDLRFPTAADGLALIRDLRGAGFRQSLVVLSGWPDELYNTPEEQMVSRVVVKGSTREFLQTVKELLRP